MFRHRSEIDRAGYSTIKLNIPLNNDLIPICQDNMDICDFGNNILTKQDAIKLKESNCQRVVITKISNITAEAYEYLASNNIKVEIKQ